MQNPISWPRWDPANLSSMTILGLLATFDDFMIGMAQPNIMISETSPNIYMPLIMTTFVCTPYVEYQ